MPEDKFSCAGYLVVEDFASAEQCTALKNRAIELLQKFDPAVVSLFSTTSRVSHAFDSPLAPGFKQGKISSDYLFQSAGNISFFLEEHAVDENGKLTCDKALAVNKIGHGLTLQLPFDLTLCLALHDLDPTFRAFSRSPKICQLMQDLNYKQPTPVQSMYICKVSLSNISQLLRLATASATTDRRECRSTSGLLISDDRSPVCDGCLGGIRRCDC